MNKKTKLLLTIAYGTMMLMPNTNIKSVKDEEKEFTPFDSENNPCYEFNKKGKFPLITNNEKEKNYNDAITPSFLSTGIEDFMEDSADKKIITYKL